MRPSRHLQRRLCGWLAAALLFMQFAVAAYACPRATPAHATGAMAGMVDCAGKATTAMDPDQPQLCKAHCERGDHAVGAAAAAFDGGAGACTVVAVLDWRATAPAASSGSGAGARLPSGAPPPGSPPLFLTLLVLRN